MSDFFSEHTVKNPRKKKYCYWCGEACEIGEPRIYSAGIWEGDFFTAHFHPECQAAREKFMEPEGYGEPWPKAGEMRRGLPEGKYDGTTP